MNVPSVVRNVERACRSTCERAAKRGESPPVASAHVAPAGTIVVLQAPCGVRTRKVGDWLHYELQCATGQAWRALSELSRDLGAALPESDVWCVGYRIQLPGSWLVAFEAQKRAA